MKKTFLIIGLTLFTGMFMAYCGGGDGGTAKDPAAAKTEFTSPTGTISADNATDVMNNTLGAANGEALQGLNSDFGVPGAKFALEKGLRRFKPNFRAQNYESCVSGDQFSATIDLACLQAQGGFDSECTAGGTVSYAIAADVMTITYNSVSVVCPEDSLTDMNGEMIFVWDADFQAWTQNPDGAAPNLIFFCVDLSAIVNGVTETASGCVGLYGDYAGYYLVDGEGGSVVVNGVGLDSAGAKVCGEFTVSGGTAVSITCDIVAPTPCNDWKEITDIDNCTFAEAACGSEFTL